MDCKEWYVNTMNFTARLTLMIFRLHAQFQVNSEGSLQLSVVHSMMIDRFPGISISVTKLTHLVGEMDDMKS